MDFITETRGFLYYTVKRVFEHIIKAFLISHQSKLVLKPTLKHTRNAGKLGALAQLQMSHADTSSSKNLIKWWSSILFFVAFFVRNTLHPPFSPFLEYQEIDTRIPMEKGKARFILCTYHLYPTKFTRMAKCVTTLLASLAGSSRLRRQSCGGWRWRRRWRRAARCS